MGRCNWRPEGRSTGGFGDAEAGVTLIELVITIAILGIAIVAIMWGMITSITVSDLHRKQATADTLARDAAEALIDVKQAYPVSGSYCFPGAPSGYSACVTEVRFCTVASTATTFTSGCSSSTDTGLQRITIVARSTDGQATETLVVMKRRAS